MLAHDWDMKSDILCFASCVLNGHEKIEQRGEGNASQKRSREKKSREIRSRRKTTSQRPDSWDDFAGTRNVKNFIVLSADQIRA